MFLASCKETKNEQIRAAVKSQLSLYPESTLQDLYKNFFQDYFGPGHLVSDTAAAGAYIDAELASFKQSAGAYYEPTGYNGNFFRVNLSVIKEGLVSRDFFFDAFLRSVKDIQIITLEEWKEEWKAIDSVICRMNLPLANYEQERATLFSLLEQGTYVVHHSQSFTNKYDPRYRIVKREIFLKEIRPLLPQ
jgi:hypothetical protein